MIQDFTTIEMGMRLIKAGIDPNTSDMYWTKSNDNDEMLPIVGRNPSIRHNLFSYREGYVIPAWSVARLFALLKDEIVIDKDSKTRKRYCLAIEKFERWLYNVAYYCHNYINDEIEVLHEESCYYSPLKALVLMLEWAMQNGYYDEEVHKEIAEKEEYSYVETRSNKEDC